MEDYFNTSGEPPDGWMNAIFLGGPYNDDVGRCVPTPLAETFIANGTRYRIVEVQQWPPSDYALAIYSADDKEPFAEQLDEARHEPI